MSGSFIGFGPCAGSVDGQDEYGPAAFLLSGPKQDESPPTRAKQANPSGEPHSCALWSRSRTLNQISTLKRVHNQLLVEATALCRAAFKRPGQAYLCFPLACVGERGGSERGRKKRLFKTWSRLGVGAVRGELTSRRGPEEPLLSPSLAAHRILYFPLGLIDARRQRPADACRLWRRRAVWVYCTCVCSPPGLASPPAPRSVGPLG